MNYYKPGECVTHQMTPAEREEERQKQEERRKQYPWRYKGKQADHDYHDYHNEQQFLSATGKRRRYKRKEK